jgi:hypothetical protein
MKANKTNKKRLPMSQDKLTTAVKKLTNALHADLETDYLKKKANLSQVAFETIARNLETWERCYIKNITGEFEIHTNNTLRLLDDFIFDPSQRSDDLTRLVNSVIHYPMEKITSQVKQLSKKQELEYKTIIRLLKNTKSSLLNIVFQYLTTFDELILEELYNREIEKLELNYLLKNQSLQILNPKKYKSFLQMINTGVMAFYFDLKSHTNLESPHFNIINKYFDTLLLKIKTLSQKYLIEFEKGQDTIACNPFLYPSHIFANLEAFQQFKESENKAHTAEDIGFLFRHFSEKSKPVRIVAKETPFRKWYNEQTNDTIKLNTPIKTWDNIKGQHKKGQMISDRLSETSNRMSSVETTKQYGIHYR